MRRRLLLVLIIAAILIVGSFLVYAYALTSPVLH